MFAVSKALRDFLGLFLLTLKFEETFRLRISLVISMEAPLELFSYCPIAKKASIPKLRPVLKDALL